MICKKNPDSLTFAKFEECFPESNDGLASVTEVERLSNLGHLPEGHSFTKAQTSMFNSEKYPVSRRRQPRGEMVMCMRMGQTVGPNVRIISLHC